MNLIVVAVLLVASLAPATPAAQSATLADLAWLEGDWHRATGAGAAVERWRRGDAGLVGEAFVERDGVSRQTEALLLVPMAGEVYYIAKPRENELPVPFRLVPGAEGDFVFENTAHDFPQRIIYRRTGADAMTVALEGPGEGGATQRFELHFERR